MQSAIGADSTFNAIAIISTSSPKQLLLTAVHIAVGQMHMKIDIGPEVIDLSTPDEIFLSENQIGPSSKRQHSELSDDDHVDDDDGGGGRAGAKKVGKKDDSSPPAKKARDERGMSVCVCSCSCLTASLTF